MEGRHGSLVAMWGNGFGGIWWDLVEDRHVWKVGFHKEKLVIQCNTQLEIGGDHKFESLMEYVFWVWIAL